MKIGHTIFPGENIGYGVHLFTLVRARFPSSPRPVKTQQVRRATFPANLLGTRDITRARARPFQSREWKRR